MESLPVGNASVATAKRVSSSPLLPESLPVVGEGGSVWQPGLWGGRPHTHTTAMPCLQTTTDDDSPIQTVVSCIVGDAALVVLGNAGGLQASTR